MEHEEFKNIFYNTWEFNKLQSHLSNTLGKMDVLVNSVGATVYLLEEIKVDPFLTPHEHKNNIQIKDLIF